MNEKILLVGGGGHCKSVLDTLFDLNTYSEIGIIDNALNKGEIIMGVPVLGDDNDLVDLFNSGFHYAFVTIGSVGYPNTRIKIYDLLIKIGFILPIIIDPSSRVSKLSSIEAGVYIGKMATVNINSEIHKGSIINTGSIIDHDCKIGAFVHIAPGAVLGGDVTVGDNTHIGSNATIKQQVNIGNNTIVGMGTVITKNVDDGVVIYGNNRRVIKKI